MIIGNIDSSRYILRASDTQTAYLVNTAKVLCVISGSLIARESVSAPAIHVSLDIIFGYKHPENYPTQRYYGSCELIAEFERMTMGCAREFLGAEAEPVNVYPVSIATSNQAMYATFSKYVYSLFSSPTHHALSKSNVLGDNFSCRWFRPVFYELEMATECINYYHGRELAICSRPRLFFACISIYAPNTDFFVMLSIVGEWGAILLVDAIHITGFTVYVIGSDPVACVGIAAIAAQKMVMYRPSWLVTIAFGEPEDALSRVVYSFLQGGSFVVGIDNKGVTFPESQTGEYRVNARRIIKKSMILAGGLVLEPHVVSDRTDRHLSIADISVMCLTGCVTNVLLVAGPRVDKAVLSFELDPAKKWAAIHVVTPILDASGDTKVDVVDSRERILKTLVSLCS